MESIVFCYVNQTWEECVAIGSYTFYHNVQKNCKQIVRLFWLRHNEQYRERMKQLQEEELLYVLQDIKKQNQKHVEYPN